MKYGNIAVVKLPLSDNVGNALPTWLYAIARIEKYSPEDQNPVEENYKCNFVPYEGLKDIFVNRSWYCQDFFGDRGYCVKEFTPDQIEKAADLTVALNNIIKMFVDAKNNHYGETISFGKTHATYRRNGNWSCMTGSNLFKKSDIDITDMAIHHYLETNEMPVVSSTASSEEIEAFAKFMHDIQTGDLDLEEFMRDNKGSKNIIVNVWKKFINFVKVHFHIT